MDAIAQGDIPTDPYLLWADATTEKPSAQPSDGKALIGVLVELRSPNDADAWLSWMNGDGRLFVPNRQETNEGDGRPVYTTRFVTGLVNRAGLDALFTSGAHHKGVLRCELMQARRDISLQAEKQSLELKEVITLLQGALASQNQQIDLQAFKGHLSIFKGSQSGWLNWLLNVDPLKGTEASATPAPGVVLGIIDDGMPVLPAVAKARTAGQFVAFWDQGWLPAHSMANPLAASLVHAATARWKVPDHVAPVVWSGSSYAASALVVRGFQYGFQLHDASQLSTGSADGYRELNYFYPTPRHSHGAGVTGLAAPWVAGQQPWPDEISGLAMVQLPSRTVRDTSGGSLANFVLDGIQYILWAERNTRPSGADVRPVVVNLSYGLHTGPHDGSSMFERAAIDLLGNNPNLHLVLPAGNGYLSGCHCQRSISPGAPASMQLRVLPDNPRDSFVEIWIPEGSQVSIEVISPDGRSLSKPLTEGWQELVSGTQGAEFAVIFPKKVTQGENGTMILLAIAPTQLRQLNGAATGSLGLNQQQRGAVWAPAGVWTVKLSTETEQPVEVHAWIARGDAAPDQSGGQRQAFFIETAGVGDRFTLNGIATFNHDRLRVVGAARLDDELSDYTASGPTRAASGRKEPDAVAPADASRNLPGLRTWGLAPGAASRINGTSAASAVEARAWIQELLAEPPNTSGRTLTPNPTPTFRGESKKGRTYEHRVNGP